MKKIIYLTILAACFLTACQETKEGETASVKINLPWQESYSKKVYFEKKVQVEPEESIMVVAKTEGQNDWLADFEGIKEVLVLGNGDPQLICDGQLYEKGASCFINSGSTLGLLFQASAVWGEESLGTVFIGHNEISVDYKAITRGEDEPISEEDLDLEEETNFEEKVEEDSFCFDFSFGIKEIE
jgi:hypothetical protein